MCRWLGDCAAGGRRLRAESSVVSAYVESMERLPVAKGRCIARQCEFIEDCEKGGVFDAESSPSGQRMALNVRVEQLHSLHLL